MKKPVLFFLLLLSVFPLHAKIPFLYEGARPAGMGRAFIAVEGDENSIFYNPAGLERMQVRVLSTGFEFHQKCATEGDYGYMSMLNSVAFAMRNLGIEVSYSWQGMYGTGGSSGRYDNYSQELEIKLAYAFKMDYPLSGGVSLRYTRWPAGSTLNGFYTDRVTYNAGLQYHLGDKLCIGVVMYGKPLGIGGESVWDDFIYLGKVYRDADLNVSAGFSYKLGDRMILAADVKNILEPDNFVSGVALTADHVPASKLKREYDFGCEYDMGKGLFARAGFFIDQPMSELETAIGSETLSRVEYNTTFGMSYANRSWKVDAAVIYTLNEGPHQTAALFWYLNLGMMFKNY